MSQWLKLDRLRLNNPELSQIHGVKVGLLASPFDVPEAVRGDFDEKNQVFVIALKYGGSEEVLLEQRFDADTLLRVGKSSGRIYQIELDLRKIKAKEVGVGIEVKVHKQAIDEAKEALDHLASRADHPWRRNNYRLAQKAINQKEAELVELIK